MPRLVVSKALGSSVKPACNLRAGQANAKSVYLPKKPLHALNQDGATRAALVSDRFQSLV